MARTGIPESFETYVHALGMWFTVSVYSPGPEHFVAVFDVITERKRGRGPAPGPRRAAPPAGALSGGLLHAQARRPDHYSRHGERQHRAIAGSDAGGGCFVRVVAGTFASRRPRPRHVRRDQGVRPRRLLHGIPPPAPGWDLPLDRRSQPRVARCGRPTGRGRGRVDGHHAAQAVAKRGVAARTATELVLSRGNGRTCAVGQGPARISRSTARWPR